LIKLSNNSFKEACEPSGVLFLSRREFEVLGHSFTEFSLIDQQTGFVLNSQYLFEKEKFPLANLLETVDLGHHLLLIPENCRFGLQELS
jgi:hypothetical protein